MKNRNSNQDDIYKIKYLEEITFHKIAEEASHFTPINYMFYNIEENIIEEVANLAKLLLVIKHIELCKKYGFLVDSFSLSCYLSSDNCSITAHELSEFLRNTKEAKTAKMKVQHDFTDELTKYYMQLDERIHTTKNVKDELLIEAAELINAEYNFNLIQETKKTSNGNNKEYYDAFINHLVETNETIYPVSPEEVIKKNKKQEDNKVKTFIKRIINKAKK